MKYYTCPCCGHYVFRDPPGSYDICPICLWEDDELQLVYFDTGGGANRLSLRESQRNYIAFGACEERLVPLVRAPGEDEPLDSDRRPLEPDDTEPPQVHHRRVDYHHAVTERTRVPYYWLKRQGAV